MCGVSVVWWSCCSSLQCGVVEVLARARELEDFVASHWEQVGVEEAFLLQFSDGKQGYMVLSIAFLNKDALWIDFLDHVFARIGEVQHAIVVLDTFLVRFLHDIVRLPIVMLGWLLGGGITAGL